ncbi:MAG: hypothetical protein GXY32_08660 [Ruminococcaceae bacterium]|nr:hypothetical protein [Oscillospiraceae bacterium]
MRPVFDKLAQSALLRTILYIVLGVLVLIAPALVMNIIVYLIAAVAIIMGIINLVGYFRGRTQGDSGFGIVSGVLLVVFGIVLIIFSGAIISILNIFLGALLILGGAVNLARTFNSGKTVGRQNIFLIVINILVIIGGILIIFNPFGAAVILFRVFGAVLVIMGVSELVTFFVYRKLGKGE